MDDNNSDDEMKTLIDLLRCAAPDWAPEEGTAVGPDLVPVEAIEMVEEVVGDAASGEGIGVEDEVSFSIHLYIGTILFLDICPLNCFTTSIIVSSSVSLDSFSTVFWSSIIY